MKIISIINQKGGIAKSSTVNVLSEGLTLKKYKTLAIDLDPQCNLTYSMGGDFNNSSIFEVLSGKAKAKDVIQKLKISDLIASNKELSGADITFNKTGKEYLLKERIEELKKEYDYIIIDTPPNLGILTINALVASDKVIIPSQANIFSLQGVENLISTIDLIKKYCNNKLQIQGILITKFKERTILNNEVADMLKKLAKQLNTKVFSSRIREAIAIQEAQIKQMGLFDYAPNSNVAEDYRLFIKEFLKG